MKQEIIVFLILAGAAAIIFLPLRFRVRYWKNGRKDFASITWQVIPGIWGITLEIPSIRFNFWIGQPQIKMVGQVEGEKGIPLGEKEKEIKVNRYLVQKISAWLPVIINRIKELKKTAYWLVGKISVKRFCWVTEIGTGEPAETAILTGTLWAVKGTFLSYFQTMAGRVRSNPQINVIPNFNKAMVTSQADCIFDVLCGHIIIGGFKILYLFLKKSGVKF